MFAIIALGTLASGSTQASELLEPPPVYQVAPGWPGILGQPPVYQVASIWPGLFSWSGFYAGGHAGWGVGAFRPTHLVIVPNTQINVSGGVAGGQAGFNFQWDALVLGVEVDVSAKGFHGSDDGTFGTVDTIAGRWGGTARLRVGYALDRWLFYVTGGGALLNYRYDSISAFVNGFPEAGGPGVASSVTDKGWVVGGGIEQAFARNWSAKVEYLYTDFGNLATNELRVGLNYKFVASY
jgi:outer membrane immunogenic protein